MTIYRKALRVDGNAVILWQDDDPTGKSFTATEPGSTNGVIYIDLVGFTIDPAKAAVLGTVQASSNTGPQGTPMWISITEITATRISTLCMTGTNFPTASDQTFSLELIWEAP